MMYKMPPDTKEKEKLFGGILDLTQFFWLLGGVGGLAIIFIALYTLTKMAIISLIPSLVPLGISIAFITVKKYNRTMTLFRYLKLKKELKIKEKKLINRRKEIL